MVYLLQLIGTFCILRQSYDRKKSGAACIILSGPTHEIGQGKIPLSSSTEVYDAEIIRATEGLSAATNNPMDDTHQM